MDTAYFERLPFRNSGLQPRKRAGILIFHGGKRCDAPHRCE